MKRILLIVVLFLVEFVSAQNYETVDSIVANYPEGFKTIKAFADKIDADFDTDLEKTRAAYYWIANHIFYDYPASRSISARYSTYRDEADLRRIQKQYAEKVIRRKRGVCEGYSQLLKFTLLELGIPCEVISGYGKTRIKDIGKLAFKSNHAWNAVLIDRKWQLIDATWSTGNSEDKPNIFDFSDEYFLTKPQLFIWNHYPEETKWQLLKTPLTKSAFFKAPLVHKGYLNSKIQLSKMDGILASKDSVKIIFNSIDIDSEYLYDFKKFSNYSQPIVPKKINGKYYMVLPFIKGFKDRVTIFINGKACLSFKIL